MSLDAEIEEQRSPTRSFPLREGRPDGPLVAERLARDIGAIVDHIQGMAATVGKKFGFNSETVTALQSILHHNSLSEGVLLDEILESTGVWGDRPQPTRKNLLINRLTPLKNRSPIAVRNLRHPDRSVKEKGYYLALNDPAPEEPDPKTEPMDIVPESEQKKLDLMLEFMMSLFCEEGTNCLACLNCLRNSARGGFKINPAYVYANCDGYYSGSLPYVSAFRNGLYKLRKLCPQYGIKLCQEGDMWWPKLSENPDDYADMITLLDPDPAQMEELERRINGRINYLGEGKDLDEFRIIINAMFSASKNGRNITREKILSTFDSKERHAQLHQKKIFDKLLAVVEQLNRENPGLLGFDIRREKKGIYRIILLKEFCSDPPRKEEMGKRRPQPVEGGIVFHERSYEVLIKAWIARGQKGRPREGSLNHQVLEFFAENAREGRSIDFEVLRQKFGDRDWNGILRRIEGTIAELELGASIKHPRYDVYYLEVPASLLTKATDEAQRIRQQIEDADMQMKQLGQQVQKLSNSLSLRGNEGRATYREILNLDIGIKRINAVISEIRGDIEAIDELLCEADGDVSLEINAIMESLEIDLEKLECGIRRIMTEVEKFSPKVLGHSAGYDELVRAIR